MPNDTFKTLVLIATLSLTGCGLKGPLFFPDKANPSTGQKRYAQPMLDKNTATIASSKNA